MTRERNHGHHAVTNSHDVFTMETTVLRGIFLRSATLLMRTARWAGVNVAMDSPADSNVCNRSVSAYSESDIIKEPTVSSDAYTIQHWCCDCGSCNHNGNIWPT